VLWIVLVLVAMVAFSTYVRGAANRARAELAGRKRYRVTITIAGSGMATRAEMRERFALEEEVTRRRIGAITDGGSGNGEMWVEIAASGDDAADQLRAVVEETGMGKRATITACP
jgi:hypothetical protein